MLRIEYLCAIIFAYFTFWCMNTNTSPANLSTDTPSLDTTTDDPNSERANIRPRAEWDEDEIFDGRPKPATIGILVVSPGAAPYPHTLDNSLEAMQQLISGNVTSFETDVFDTVGIAHDEGLLLRLPPNRLIPVIGAVIFG